MDQLRTFAGRTFLLGAVAAGVLGFVACDDDEASAEEVAEVEDLVATLFASGAADADYVFEHATDNLFQTAFFTTRAECEANVEECLGEPTPAESVTGTKIDGDRATALVTADFGQVELVLVKEDGSWKADAMRSVSDEVPDGTEKVELTLVDFGFQFDSGDIPAGGDFAFTVSNEGDQVHEVLVFAIGPDGSIEEALESVAGPPEAVKVPIVAGQEVDIAFATPLTPGRYALLCFLPDSGDPAGTPHVAKGMAAEFTVE